MSQLLVVGPAGLENYDTKTDICGGWGLTAAIAAVPLAATNLWSDLGDDFPSQVFAMLEQQRHLRMGGCSETGPTLRRQG